MPDDGGVGKREDDSGCPYAETEACWSFFLNVVPTRGTLSCQPPFLCIFCWKRNEEEKTEYCDVTGCKATVECNSFLGLSFAVVLLLIFQILCLTDGV